MVSGPLRGALKISPSRALSTWRRSPMLLSRWITPLRMLRTSIEYTFYNATLDKTDTIRVKSPTATSDPINPATVSGEGVTDPEHAAKLARYHLGQSLFQYKDISYGTTAESLSYKRLDKLMLQHDLTQWGYGGRVVSAERIADGKVRITWMSRCRPSRPRSLASAPWASGWCASST
ncbi:tail fiber protein [Stenotrophomonas phage CM2]